jgi:capsular exopolysaccharide synthesis family protein
VTNSLVTNVGLETTSEYLPEETSISVVSGTPYLTITATMDSSADAIAITNSYGDALEATETFSSINLGDLRFRLEVVESAQTATAIMATVENVEPTTRSSLPLPVMLVIVGLFIGFSGALIVEWLDGRATWPKQVSARIGLVSVGSVGEQSCDVTDLEPFRAAKARINSLLPRGSRGRSLLVTSARARDGKTMVITNLARAFAENGSTVMIVSADVRSETSIDGIWSDNEGRRGLSDYLNDLSVLLDEIITTTPESGISLIARGSTPDAVVPRVDSRRMNDLLDELAERVDRILFDGSAVLDFADAARLSPLIDGTILVVDGKRTTLSAAESASELLVGAGAEVIGFFHNRTRGNPVARMLHQEIA